MRHGAVPLEGGSHRGAIGFAFVRGTRWRTRGKKGGNPGFRYSGRRNWWHPFIPSPPRNFPLPARFIWCYFLRSVQARRLKENPCSGKNPGFFGGKTGRSWGRLRSGRRNPRREGVRQGHNPRFPWEKDATGQATTANPGSVTRRTTSGMKEETHGGNSRCTGCHERDATH